MNRPSIVIVGGGITGLSAAYAIKQLSERHGIDVSCTLFEKDTRLGGKIRTHRENGFVMEEGPDSILARKPSGMGLIKALGLESEVVGSNPANQKTYILHNRRLEPLPIGTNMGVPVEMRPFAKTRLVSWPGKLRALFDLVLPKSNPAQDVSLGTFLRHRLGDEVVNRIIEPLLAGIYAGSVNDLSLQATFPQFQALEQQYGSLIRGSAQQRKKAPSSVPATGRSAFVTLRTGLQSLTERLFDELHTWADIHTSAMVTRLDPIDGSAYQVEWRDDEGTHNVAADAVFVTTPAHNTAALLRHLCPETEKLLEIPYVSTATVLLGYHADSIRDPLDGSGFVIPRTEGRGITALTWTTTKWPHTTPKDHVLIRCYVGRAGQQEGLQQSDEDMVTMVRRELADILGIDATPWFSHVARWNHAMPQYTVGHPQRVAQVKQSLARTVPGIFVAGAAYNGVGVPDCIADAESTAANAWSFLFGSPEA